MKRKIILASTSPRRKELLARTGLVFDVAPANYEEDMTIPLSPEDLVKHLSLGKAKSLISIFDDAIIIAADTIVVCGGQVLGKPHTPQRAIEMLQLLSGSTHSVFTGISIVDTAQNKIIQKAVETKIYFKSISDKEIEEYVATGDPLDKAGAYGIQGAADKFVEKIEGDFDNIVGLPVADLLEILKDLDNNSAANKK